MLKQNGGGKDTMYIKLVVAPQMDQGIMPNTVRESLDISFVKLSGNPVACLLTYMYLSLVSETGVCALILIAVLIYFPSRPPSCPSISAAIGKLEFKEGIRDLFRYSLEFS